MTLLLRTIVFLVVTWVLSLAVAAALAASECNLPDWMFFVLVINGPGFAWLGIVETRSRIRDLRMSLRSFHMESERAARIDDLYREFTASNDDEKRRALEEQIRKLQQHE